MDKFTVLCTVLLVLQQIILCPVRTSPIWKCSISHCDNVSWPFHVKKWKVAAFFSNIIEWIMIMIPASFFDLQKLLVNVSFYATGNQFYFFIFMIIDCKIGMVYSLTIVFILYLSAVSVYIWEHKYVKVQSCWLRKLILWFLSNLY
jgi:hypothetical protein